LSYFCVDEGRKQAEGNKTMRKAVNILVIVTFLLSIVAIVLGHMLYVKRELLKGRTQKLEKAVMDVAKFVEKEPAAAPQDMSAEEFPAKDISPCKPEVLEKPETSNYWTKYKRHLETLDVPVLDLETDEYRLMLMNLYQRDPLDNSIKRDPATGFPIMKGEGTMSYVLDDILIAKAREQYDRLNETRLQLKDVRGELAATIKDFNSLKQEHRARLKEIVELKNEIARLNDQIRQLNQKIEEIEAEKQRLQDENNQIKADMAKLQETVEERDTEIAQLKKKIQEMERLTARSDDRSRMEGLWIPPPGVKGKVILVDTRWNFVIVELSDEFVQETLASGRQDLVGAELLVRRAGEHGEFVTKIMLVSFQPGTKLAAADNLVSWQQRPIQEGDILFR